jgi:hypothetical protein
MVDQCFIQVWFSEGDRGLFEGGGKNQSLGGRANLAPTLDKTLCWIQFS